MDTEQGIEQPSQESGTVLFRQTDHEIPFDITSIKVFEYDHEPLDSVESLRAFITKVLSETLKRNRLDSPVRLALRAQWGDASSPQTSGQAPRPEKSSAEIHGPGDGGRTREVERFMRDAEEALRLGDLDLARTNYWVVLRLDPLNTIARMRLGLTLKAQGKHYQALEEFVCITKLAPNYGEAWKEKGVVEGLFARKIAPHDRPKWLPDGYASLERATMLIPDDFDAWASLGGVLKNVRSDPKGAHEKYAHAAKISDGHPYPLLNALKLQVQLTGKLDLKSLHKQIKTADTRAAPPSPRLRQRLAGPHRGPW